MRPRRPYEPKNYGCAHRRSEDLLPGYLERRRLELEAVETSLGASDFSALLTFGHNVKGTAGSYGLPDLGNLAEVVHAAAAEQSLAACQQALAAYRDYLARIEIKKL